MNREEFGKWITHHLNCFPGVRSWMEKNAIDGEVQPILNTWFSCLEKVSLDSAIEASSMMHRGEVKMPYTSSHPARIRETALSLDNGNAMIASGGMVVTEIRSNGEVIFNCDGCCDSGRRVVIKPAAARRIVAVVDSLGDDWKVTDLKLSKGFREAVACDCISGQKYSRERRSKITGQVIPAMPVYDSTGMLRFNPAWDTNQLIEECRNWLNS